ncbi:MAG TPA: MarR family transcriptional regulator [Steroidobacteraceae bacterium]
MRTTKKTRAALENRALLAARELIDRMRALYRELEQLTGAPIGLHRALVCIGNEPGLQASRLALRLGMQRPAVSQVLKSLTLRGWIERRRSDTDQRAIQIHPTAAGRQLLRATAGRAVFTLQRAVCQLPQPDLERLASSVELLLDLLPEAGSAVAPASRRHRRKPGR